jgi:hypothetical protein
MKTSQALVLAFMLTGCSYPAVHAQAVDARPHLAIAGAPAEALLNVDGVALGAAADYAPDRRVLALDHGTHRVVVSVGGRVLFDNSIYFGNGTDRVVTLPQ